MAVREIARAFTKLSDDRDELRATLKDVVETVNDYLGEGVEVEAVDEALERARFVLNPWIGFLYEMKGKMAQIFPAAMSAAMLAAMANQSDRPA